MTLGADLIFVIGLVIGVLAFPALLSAFSEGRSPRAAAIMIMICAGLIATAVLQKPEGSYSIGKIPEVFTKVIGDILR
ncbi:hypothetical protein R3X27_18495 [Tropicimonas sp. TH_r6]|uniref:hypothetical protein n=1 Tax=Tropicimonas sp. TH_r6 TaxID=3082085 RepID=UPI002952AEC4|nr:hypothetical protein [Tropicimonas sp. TH_r6]MDV7144674.1 hypothetical protein [Tropicimonas sp. TH_r6]